MFGYMRREWIVIYWLSILWHVSITPGSGDHSQSEAGIQVRWSLSDQSEASIYYPRLWWPQPPAAINFTDAAPGTRMSDVRWWDDTEMSWKQIYFTLFLRPEATRGSHAPF